MIKFIDFYFDFISPYSFLAYKKIKLLKDININYKPILLGGLHKLGGITAPAFNERKMKNMKNDCEIIAKKNDIKFIWNNKFPLNSLSLMRGYLAIANEYKENYYYFCVTCSNPRNCLVCRDWLNNWKFQYNFNNHNHRFFRHIFD